MDFLKRCGLIPQSETINADIYCLTLSRQQSAIRRKRNEIPNMYNVGTLHDKNGHIQESELVIISLKESRLFSIQPNTSFLGISPFSGGEKFSDRTAIQVQFTQQFDGGRTVSTD
ncbi:hypothetical protein TNIN_139751 [Trichonephila inaurata madagascariensis]|uniref:Uncharacterized protein n=1 Tax=Trichonephila inaurata madagascariensis TaxID=2747483 RepID=A0A8X6IEX6_9ARAC|nr:hypothetical protein TNIN_139751 [Trichonephila inaurata madagascariensis]